MAPPADGDQVTAMRRGLDGSYRCLSLCSLHRDEHYLEGNMLMLKERTFVCGSAQSEEMKLFKGPTYTGMVEEWDSLSRLLFFP